MLEEEEQRGIKVFWSTKTAINNDFGRRALVLGKQTVKTKLQYIFLLTGNCYEVSLWVA